MPTCDHGDRATGRLVLTEDCLHATTPREDQADEEQRIIHGPIYFPHRPRVQPQPHGDRGQDGEGHDGAHNRRAPIGLEVGGARREWGKPAAGHGLTMTL